MYRSFRPIPTQSKTICLCLYHSHPWGSWRKQLDAPILSLFLGWKNAILGLSCAPCLTWLQLSHVFLVWSTSYRNTGQSLPLTGVSTHSLKVGLGWRAVQARLGRWNGQAVNSQLTQAPVAGSFQGEVLSSRCFPGGNSPVAYFGVGTQVCFP